MVILETEDHKRLVKDFKKKHGLDEQDDSAAVTIHLMNQHRLDEHEALDQSSRGGEDEGIDGWCFDEKSGELYVYQSKFSPNKKYVLQGFSDILRAKDWLELVLIKGEVKEMPTNNGLYTLYMALGKNKEKIAKITFILSSLVDENKLEDEKEYSDCKRGLVNSNLNKQWKTDLKLAEYNFNDTSLPLMIKTYPITRTDCGSSNG